MNTRPLKPSPHLSKNVSNAVHCTAQLANIADSSVLPPHCVSTACELLYKKQISII